MPSPSTPRPGTSHSRNGDIGSHGGFGSVLDTRNGLGSLADELAEAYSDEEEGEEEGEEEEEGEPEEWLSGDQVAKVGDSSNGYKEGKETRFNHGEALHNGISTSSIPRSTSDTTSTPTPSMSSKHRRQQSR